MRNVGLLSLLLASSALARPIEAVKADRNAATVELADLDRRASSLDEQVGLRQRMLKHRVRALYKLTQGGSLRLLVEAKDLEEVGARLDAAHRVIGRDLHEIAALDDELAELARDRQLRAEQAARVPVTEGGPRVGLERRRGDLPRPVPGAIVVGLGHVRVTSAGAGIAALELPRRTVEMSSSPGENVRAIASGTVRFVGPVEGLGQAVVIDHGERYATFTGRLRQARVVVGALVGEGEVLGQAESSSISFELSESRTALDPGTWLRAPTPRIAIPDGPAHAAVVVEHAQPL